MTGLRMRPCGVCKALVPADTGCYHWRPDMQAKSIRQRERRERERQMLEAFRRQQRLGKT